MIKNEPLQAVARDTLVALALLSRLPVPQAGTTAEPGRTARAAWAYPLAGLAIGGLAALAGAVAHAAGLPAPLTALFALAVLILSTGAMHEDGLADTADGLWGGWSRERRLEIMRDSRIGAYGVIALVLSLLARWAALWLFYETGPGAAAAAILTAAALSRAAMPALMTALPHARDDGLSHGVGRVDRPTAGLAALLAVLVAVILSGWAAVAAAIWVALAALAIGAAARARIGGQTGDILGATQQIAEIAVLFSLIA